METIKVTFNIQKIKYLRENLKSTIYFHKNIYSLKVLLTLIMFWLLFYLDGKKYLFARYTLINICSLQTIEIYIIYTRIYILLNK